MVKKPVFLWMKLMVPILITVALITVLSVPLDPSIPPLGGLLLPNNGIWRVPRGYARKEEWRVPTLTAPVTVVRDDWGIPHIYGAHQNDLAFAMGYTQAEDRLFFMDLARRFARGQLAEILGPSVLGDDLLSRTKLLEYYAQKTYDHLRTSTDPDDRDYVGYLDSYVAGVNFYVKTHPDHLPLEFHLLNYDFKPWTGVDCMAIGYFMLDGGSWGYWDIDRLVAMSAFVRHFGQAEGIEAFQELFGNPGRGRVLPYQIPVNPGYGEWPDIAYPALKRTTVSHAHPAAAGGLNRLAADFRRLQGTLLQSGREAARLREIDFSGSNSWAVHGSRTASGRPLACSDSHEPWQLPNIYYETHAVDSAGGRNFYGYFVAGGAGTPVDGHNQHLAWGLTVCHWDQIDWYYYDAVDDHHYLYNGQPTAYEEPMTVEIAVKGKQPATHTIRRTRHGPVFSDLGRAIPNALSHWPNSAGDKIIAARWLSHKVVDLGPTLLGMTRARNLTEFKAALKGFQAPPNHVTYADAAGNIAAWSMGGFPVRDNSDLPAWHLGNGSMPYNGSRGEGEWTGMVSFDTVPQTVNPEMGYVVGANQIAAGPEYFKQYVGQFRYREGYRARRLNALLAAGSKLTAGDMACFQTDIHSVRAEDFLPHLLAALDAQEMRTPLEQTAYDLLADWNCRMDRQLAAPGIFRAWVEFMAEDTFRDEWDAMGLSDRLFPRHPVLEKLIRTRPDSHWFDNAATPDVTETAATLIPAAFSKALTALRAYFGTDDPSRWLWGTLHQLEFFHMTGELDALNYGPVPYSGGSNTVSAPHNTLVQGGKIAPDRARRGAHHRMIVDFGNLENNRSVLPGGVSGLSTLGAPYDQFELFVTGNYHNEYFTADTPEKLRDRCRSVTSTVVFVPRQEG